MAKKRGRGGRRKKPSRPRYHYDKQGRRRDRKGHFVRGSKRHPAYIPPPKGRKPRRKPPKRGLSRGERVQREIRRQLLTLSEHGYLTPIVTVEAGGLTFRVRPVESSILRALYGAMLARQLSDLKGTLKRGEWDRLISDQVNDVDMPDTLPSDLDDLEGGAGSVYITPDR